MRITTRITITTSTMVTMAIVTTSIFCNSGQRCAEALSAGPTKTKTATAISPTDIPPLVDVPVWSMATRNNDGDNDVSNNNSSSNSTTNMNLLTYATPVSIRPSRLYALGLYKETKSRDNFLREKTCVLQLLHEKHIGCVRLLGGASGKVVSKEERLASEHGIELEELTLEGNGDGDGELPKVLPGCVRYLQLSMVGDSVTDYDGGESSHDVVICKVDKMWTSSDSCEDTDSGGGGDTDADTDTDGGDYLSTGRLRELGLITEQGRIAPLPDEE